MKEALWYALDGLMALMLVAGLTFIAGMIG
jgi:hypothetical protein